ncbi:HEXXH motif-containing protein [Thermocatellispora tengchongensis]|uniref:HEXXH motif-containing protein n=1 Tax=Thermocatellispora tengchongensis TaxID=1073253 RepID=A0A840PCJ1_9ACTN|nr:HEXXH motif-containing putative peptide modification protein [Thermocatellispora tengchongensis]MBB5139144.1 HEXXH motif-containing protein [Thermocatellispora tengchongensis]
MIPPRHALPAPLLTALSHGGGGAEAASHLAAAEHSKHLLLLAGALHASGGGAGTPPAEALRVLAEAERADREAVREVITYPATGAWAAATIMRGRGAPDAVRAGFPACVAAAAALRTGTRATLLLPAARGPTAAPGTLATVRLPSLGRAVFGVPCETVLFRSGPGGGELIADGLRLPIAPDAGPAGAGPARWEAIRRMDLAPDTAGFPVALDDVGGYALPGAPAPAGRLGAAAARHWEERLRAGWRLLTREHPGPAAEIRSILKAVVPLTGPGERPPGGSVPGSGAAGERWPAGASATARAAFGAMGLSPPGDAVATAVALVHEAQHAKLAALMDLYELTVPGGDGGPLLYAPWRIDPRPPAAVLHGCYAHLGVAAFWRVHRHTEPDPGASLRAHAEYAHWREATRRAARTLLAGDRLTPMGRRFATGILRAAEAMSADPVPAPAAALARAAAARHRARWLHRNHTQT